jgi:hypothetical protein
MTTKNTVEKMLAFSVAVAAYRINGGYYKEPQVVGNVVLPPNKVLARELINTPEKITTEDKEQAELLVQYFKGYTFRLLTGQISEFERNFLDLAQQEQIVSRDIGLLCYAPQAYNNYLKTRTQEQKLEQCAREHLGEVGDRASGHLTVISSVYSSNWWCHFITAVTDTGHRIQFVSKQGLTEDGRYTFKGKIRELADSYVTKLNYVKLIQK